MPRGPKAPQVVNTKPKAKRSRGASVLSEFLRAVQVRHEKLRGAAWPAVQWQTDICGFAWHVCGIRLARHQRRILKKLMNPEASVAVSSGQKIGKTMLFAIAMIWYWASFPKAKVTMTATTETQVDNVIWDEVKNVVRLAKSKRNVDLLAGGSTLAENPRTGLEAPDGRSIRGLTVQQIEALGGISGENQLICADEASALEQKFYEAMTGNSAAGARFLFTSNPTRDEGPFFEIFNNPKIKKYWTTFLISSEDIAKEQAQLPKSKRTPGLARLSVIQRWEEMFGRDSFFFIVRVLGQFPMKEAGKIIAMHYILEAQKRWKGKVNEQGTLRLGVDWAGTGRENDKWAFCARRGFRCLESRTRVGLTVPQGAIEALKMVRQYRVGDEVPKLIIDAEGDEGSKLLKILRAESDRRKLHDPHNQFEVYGVRASKDANREPHLYVMIRDELLANLARWVKEGGAIPPKNFDLARDLNASSWIEVEDKRRGRRLKATPKKELRKAEALGRSPDEGDALALAVWEPSTAYEEGHREEVARGQQAEMAPALDVFDAATELMGSEGGAMTGGDGEDWWQK